MLLEEFEARRKSNRSFSIRGFGRFLQIPTTTLKFLVDGSREPNTTTLLQIARRCGWSEQIVLTIREELARSRRAGRHIYKENYKSVDDVELLSDLTYFALSRLARLPNQSASVAAIAKALNVSAARARSLLKNLVKGSYVKVSDGQLKAGDRRLFHAEDPPGERTRALTKQMLNYLQDFYEREEIELGRAAISFIGVSKKDLQRLPREIFRSLLSVQKKFPNDEDAELYAVMFAAVPYAGAQKK